MPNTSRTTQQQADAETAAKKLIAYLKSLLEDTRGLPQQYNEYFGREILTDEKFKGIIKKLLSDKPDDKHAALRDKTLEQALIDLEPETDIRFYKWNNWFNPQRVLSRTATIRKTAAGKLELTLLTNYTLANDTKLASRPEFSPTKAKVFKPAPALSADEPDNWHAFGRARLRVQLGVGLADNMAEIEALDAKNNVKKNWTALKREVELARLCAKDCEFIAAPEMGSPFIRLDKHSNTKYVNVYLYDDLGKYGPISKLFDKNIDSNVPVFTKAEQQEINFALAANMAPQIYLSLIRNILTGVKAIHAARVIHQDLKSDNIYLSRDKNGRLFAKIADFGLAKHKDDAYEMRTCALASRTYESPQISKIHIAGVDNGYITGCAEFYKAEPSYARDIYYAELSKDPQSVIAKFPELPEERRRECTPSTANDMWSLGILFFQMLTGKYPKNNDSFTTQVLDLNPFLKGLLDPYANSRLDIDSAIAAFEQWAKNPIIVNTANTAILPRFKTETKKPKRADTTAIVSRKENTGRTPHRPDF